MGTLRYYVGKARGRIKAVAVRLNPMYYMVDPRDRSRLFPTIRADREDQRNVEPESRPADLYEAPYYN